MHPCINILNFRKEPHMGLDPLKTRTAYSTENMPSGSAEGVPLDISLLACLCDRYIFTMWRLTLVFQPFCASFGYWGFVFVTTDCLDRSICAGLRLALLLVSGLWEHCFTSPIRFPLIITNSTPRITKLRDHGADEVRSSCEKIFRILLWTEPYEPWQRDFEAGVNACHKFCA